MKLTPHFTLEELVASQTAARRGIDNTPGPDVLKNLGILAEGLERARALLGAPMLISSGYRCPALNTAVGGARNSAHKSGLAADFIAPGYGTPIQVCRLLEVHAAEIGFDQLIQEGTWVHIGFPAPNAAPRREVLTANFGAGGTTYSKGLS